MSPEMGLVESKAETEKQKQFRGDWDSKTATESLLFVLSGVLIEL